MAERFRMTKGMRASQQAVRFGKILPRGQLTLPRDVRRAAGLAPGDTGTFRVTGESTVEIKALPRLTLQDLLEQFPIEGDFAEDFARGGWQDDAAREIIEKMEQ